jgi:DNA adenine methylase
MGFFRYPGGKSKVRREIVDVISKTLGNNGITEYCEPFAGGLAIGLEFLKQNPHIESIGINDKDVGVAALWTSVIRLPGVLKRYVRDFIPSVEAFDQYKHELLATDVIPATDAEIALLGFKKLAIHQISYSGLGTKSGGPLGGRDQKSNYKIDCRWSPDYICKQIDKLNIFLGEFEVRNGGCTSLDFEQVLAYQEKPAILYLDPPYYDKGGELYQCSFSTKDHQRLANILKKSSHQWVLSYDDCPEIRSIYEWADVKTLAVKCTINGTKDNEGERQVLTKTELLISRKL